MEIEITWGNAIRVWWAYFWRSLIATIVAVIVGGMVGAILGFVMGMFGAPVRIIQFIIPLLV